MLGAMQRAHFLTWSSNVQEVIEGRRGSMNDSGAWQTIFATPTQDFDQAILLDPVALPHSHRSLPVSPKLQPKALPGSLPHHVQAILQHIPAGVPCTALPSQLGWPLISASWCRCVEHELQCMKVRCRVWPYIDGRLLWQSIATLTLRMSLLSVNEVRPQLPPPWLFRCPWTIIQN